MEPSSYTLGDIVNHGIIYHWIEELLILAPRYGDGHRSGH